MNSEESQQLDLTFTEERPDGTTVPLIRNGETVKVNEKNKMKYIMLLCEYNLVVRSKPYLDQLRTGFRNVAGTLLDKKLTPETLRRLLCGEEKIDVEALIQFAHLFIIPFILSFLFHLKQQPC